MKASFVEKSPLVVKLMAFYNLWRMDVGVEYVSSYASKQLQNWYHWEQNKISKIIIKSK